MLAPREASTHIYVDDPIFIIPGSGSQAIETATIATLWLTVLGFPLAWSKTEAGDALTWIGASISTSSAGVSVTIPEDKITSIATELQGLLSASVTVASTLGARVKVPPGHPLAIGVLYAAERQPSKALSGDTEAKTQDLLCLRRVTLGDRWSSVLNLRPHRLLCRHYHRPRPCEVSGTTRRLKVPDNLGGPSHPGWHEDMEGPVPLLCRGGHKVR